MIETTASYMGVPLPEWIGPYRILQILGEGGMGVVYEAEETGAVRRRVALKVVRAGRDTREVVSRFEAERQALAVMNHPAIARVFNAGTTETGQPFFAMELVKGLPITQYCDMRRLSVPERIELFIAVCHGVQHAHQKGVIHRDLKPSNVLVGEQDGIPQPKIIDFGIAKAMGSQLTEHTLVTQFGQMIGTAAYMSPEQADAGVVDVDTRTDIYALGVMLFELLVGRLPVDPAQLGVNAFLARLAAGDTAPPTPSVKLTTMGSDQALVAATRRTEPATLRRELRGDLDWIVMKAMEPDRTRRYETAIGLASDLRRHLLNEPVTARPRSARYRVGKFIRRHRGGVIGAAVVTIAVIASAIMATVGFVRATRAERRAAQEAAAAQAVTTFLVDLFRISDPGESRGDTLTAREILNRGAHRVTMELSQQPLLQSRIMYTLGTVQEALGLLDQSRDILGEALRVRERMLGPDDPLVAEALNALGDVSREKSDFVQADSSYQRALRIRLKAFGENNVDVATTLGGIAALRYRQGRLAEAESTYLRVLALDERVRPDSDPRLARDLRGLAAVYYSGGHYDRAEPLWRRALAIQERTLGADHYDVAGTLMNLAALAWIQGRYDDALPLNLRARPILEKSLPPTHPRYAELLNNLGETYWKLGKYDDAEPLLRKALQIKEQVLGAGHPSVAVTLNALAGVLRNRGQRGEAERLYRGALAIRRKFPGSSSSDLRETLRDFASMLRADGRLAEATALEKQAAGAR